MKKNLSIFMTAGSWLQRALALFLCVAALEAVQAAPQDTKRTITGTVVDQNNLPVAGATVMVSNTSNGTATDSNGQFSLSGVTDNDELQISFLGYKTVVDWDKTSKESVTALIEVKITPQKGMGFDEIARQIYSHHQVEGVYLMSGGFDLTVIIKGRTMREVARFVSEQLAPMATGHEAAWRGARITRTSCTRYLPPNWAPTPLCWQILSTFSSHSRSRKQRPPSLPEAGHSSR